jgi:hypothetical protein
MRGIFRFVSTLDTPSNGVTSRQLSEHHRYGGIHDFYEREEMLAALPADSPRSEGV